MNLNQITPGTDYAYFPMRGKQEEFRWSKRDNSEWDEGSYSFEYGAKYYVYRVKAIRTYSERQPGKTRDTGYVDCFWLDDEGEFRFDEAGNHVIKKVPVRHIATIWEDYEDELDRQTMLKEKREREREERRARERAEWEERARLREERERIEREERERIRQQEELRKKEYIKNIETHYGLPEGSVSLSSFGDIIVLDKAMVDSDIATQQYLGQGLDGEQKVSI